MTQRTLFFCIATVGFLTLPPHAIAQFESERISSCIEMEIKSPLITGTVWIDRGSLETIQPIDRDGDFEYSFDELNAARPFFDAYLQRNLLVIWGQHVAPPKISNVEPTTRPRAGRPCFRIDFRMTDVPPNVSTLISSRLLSDLSPRAQTYLRVRRDGRDELCVLGLANCYRTDRAPLPIPLDGAYRPDAQRGRIAALDDLAFEMLYALPEGAFYLYTLGRDQATPLGVADKTMNVSIQPGKDGSFRPKTFTAKPLTCDKPGRSSRFTCPAPEFGAVSVFNADISIGAGLDLKRVIFEFPAVTIPPADAKPEKRLGCPNLCPGIELKDGAVARCPRCGAKLVELLGEPVPGLGFIGPHGGLLAHRADGSAIFEALVTPANEFRLYLTNDRLEELPTGELTGSVFCSTDERFQQTIVEVVLKRAAGGHCLTAAIPETTPIPVHTRLVYDFHDGKPAAQVDFFFEKPIILEGATTVPATPQPAATMSSDAPSATTMPASPPTPVRAK